MHSRLVKAFSLKKMLEKNPCRISAMMSIPHQCLIFLKHHRGICVRAVTRRNYFSNRVG